MRAAFWQLSSDRQLGFGLGPVPHGAIDRWATRHGIDDLDDFDDLVSAIRAMDEVFLAHIAKAKTGEAPPKIHPPMTMRELAATMSGAKRK